jgi:UDP-N-acetylmuramoylalanine--D-glutamate ligase
LPGRFGEAFAGIEMIALSPGVPVQEPVIAGRAPRRAGGLGESSCSPGACASWCRGSKIIAITGSNGKTTTTALTAHLLRAAGVPASPAATSRRRRSTR